MGIDINCYNCYNFLGRLKAGEAPCLSRTWCVLEVVTFPTAARDPGAGCVPPLQAPKRCLSVGNARSLGGVWERLGMCLVRAAAGSETFSLDYSSCRWHRGICAICVFLHSGGVGMAASLGSAGSVQMPVASGGDSWRGQAGMGTGAGTQSSVGRLRWSGDVASLLALPGGNGFGRMPLPCAH